MEEEVKKECKCNENCTCGDDCRCDIDCKCEESCNCGKEKENKKCDKVSKKEKKDKAKAEIKRLEELLKTTEEKLKYQQAELINYRKRKDEEVLNRLKYANQDLITELIPIIDNFERAIKLDDDNLDDELSKFLSGFKMMYASLMEILKRFGVEEINPAGEIFNPNTSEALMTDCNSELEDEAVTEVLLKGYKLKDRVIRPASVKINKIN